MYTYTYISKSYVHIFIYHPQHPPTTLPTKDSWTSRWFHRATRSTFKTRNTEAERPKPAPVPAMPSITWWSFGRLAVSNQVPVKEMMITSPSQLLVSWVGLKCLGLLVVQNPGSEFWDENLVDYSFGGELLLIFLDWCNLDWSSPHITWWFFLGEKVFEWYIGIPGYEFLLNGKNNCTCEFANWCTYLRRTCGQVCDVPVGRAWTYLFNKANCCVDPGATSHPWLEKTWGKGLPSP